MIHRRRFLSGAAALGGGAAVQSLLLPAWARSGPANAVTGLTSLSGNEFYLRAGRARPMIDGKAGNAITINGQLPAPLLRWREGDEVTLHLTNDLDEDTSIHWHGILLPPEMDGVPGISFPGVRPGETFTYRFPVKQAGTYWYHSHSGLQEQAGQYGPIIIEPKGVDPIAADREYVIVLSDWTYEKPEHLFAKLKKNPDSLNYQRRTLIDFFRDADDKGFGAAFKDRAMWGGMRMDPADIADVTGATYTYLINGHGPGDNWTGLFTPGERVRLRIINASAMTIFNLRLPALAMTVVMADGLAVDPVETDEIQIGVAETYDVIVTPKEDKAYTLMAESIDRSGFGRATLAPRIGMSAPVPPLRERPTLTMRDMGMKMTGAGMDMRMDMSVDKGGASGMGEMPGDVMGHEMGAMQHEEMKTKDGMSMAGGVMTHNRPKGFGVDMVAENPRDRLAEPGLGLAHVGHRVLTYADLSARDVNPDMRDPEREIEIHLTGNMHRYMWSFDGEKFSEVDGPIVFHEGERLRMTLVNDTMMSHPIHLHGMFFDVVNNARPGRKKARKHTIIVKPGEKLSVDITADAVGEWAFHCHLLYHMAAGMMQVVSVRPKDGDAPHDMHMMHGEDS